ncbi:hypothetical protein DFJ73DRAFT_840703 [Zopfochytrium polystomum]|nr:hypothetical protein DFJ73DRAFT_840703 [Zopfochytrium polystomum]
MPLTQQENRRRTQSTQPDRQRSDEFIAGGRSSDFRDFVPIRPDYIVDENPFTENFHDEEDEDQDESEDEDDDDDDDDRDTVDVGLGSESTSIAARDQKPDVLAKSSRAKLWAGGEKGSLGKLFSVYGRCRRCHALGLSVDGCVPAKSYPRAFRSYSHYSSAPPNGHHSKGPCSRCIDNNTICFYTTVVDSSPILQTTRLIGSTAVLGMRKVRMRLGDFDPLGSMAEHEYQDDDARVDEVGRAAEGFVKSDHENAPPDGLEDFEDESSDDENEEMDDATPVVNRSPDPESAAPPNTKPMLEQPPSSSQKQPSEVIARLGEHFACMPGLVRWGRATKPIMSNFATAHGRNDDEPPPPDDQLDVTRYAEELRKKECFLEDLRRKKDDGTDVNSKNLLHEAHLKHHIDSETVRFYGTRRSYRVEHEVLAGMDVRYLLESPRLRYMPGVTSDFPSIRIERRVSDVSILSKRIIRRRLLAKRENSNVCREMRASDEGFPKHILEAASLQAVSGGSRRSGDSEELIQSDAEGGNPINESGNVRRSSVIADAANSETDPLPDGLSAYDATDAHFTSKVFPNLFPIQRNAKAAADWLERVRTIEAEAKRASMRERRRAFCTLMENAKRFRNRPWVRNRPRKLGKNSRQAAGDDDDGGTRKGKEKARD